MNASWNITGSPNQISIASEALNRIFFPFERLALPGVPELGWRDLNGLGARSKQGEFHLPHPPGAHTHGDEPHLIEGEFEGRRYTLGVFYTGSATIYIDNALEAQPEVAAAVVAAEIAHAVDYFLPLTDTMRDTFIRLLNDGQPNQNTWWEISDYSTEYFTLGGEAFMFLFCRGYSDIPFGDVSSFEDKGENITPQQIRGVIGIERTDAAPKEDFVSFGKSKIYHRSSHYKKRGTPVVNIEQFRACKICTT
jgi:hypothetical protein